MKGQVLTPVLTIIIALMLLTLFIYTRESPIERGRGVVENVTAGVVRLLSPPDVAAIGPDSCDAAGACSYPLSLSGLRVSLDRPGDAAVTLHFRDWDAVAAVIPLAEDSILDLAQTFRDDYALTPFVLNASDRNLFDGLVYDDQRLILGNFTLDFQLSIRYEPSIAGVDFTVIENALLDIACGSESLKVALKEGDLADIPLCGGSVFINMSRIATSTRPASGDEDYACVQVATLGGPRMPIAQGLQPGDSVTVRFWKFDDVFRTECGLGGVPLAEGQTFSLGRLSDALQTRQSCSSRAMGGFTFAVPVKEWRPGASSVAEESCSISY
jgi:hypothetical protein